MKRLMVLLTLWFGVLPAVLAAGWSPACISPITIGQPVSGQLTTSDCSWNYTLTPQHRYYTDVYSFTGTAGQQVSVLLTSPTLDMYVEIYNVNDLNAAPLVANDNGGGGLNARIPAGSGLFTLPASGTYYIWAQTVDPDWTGAYTLTLGGASAVPPPAATPNAVTVTEFYHPVFNHYFITAYPEEAASLSAGNLPPWVPTGNTFKVWDAAGSGITNVCRFFNNEFAPRSSHFYSNNPVECPSLSSRSRWVLESANAFYMMTSPTGSCMTGTVPLYRLYNNGLSGAPNHRYTTSQAVRTSMIAAGWIPEGNGPDGVFACVPPGGSSPPPPTSAFQAEVTGYANTVLGLLSGNAIDIDQLLLILGAALESLETPSTCPVTTSNPPIQGLDSFPPSLTITSSFGSGCTVPGTATSIGGSLVIKVNNLVVSDNGIAGSVEVAFNGLSVNGVPVANGTVAATLNLVISGGFAKSAQRAALSIPRITGTVTVTLTGLQLPNGIGASGTATITLDTTGATLVSTNITTTPHGVAIKLNASVSAQSDGSVLVNTTGPSTVGPSANPYAVTVDKLSIDTEVCANSPKGGTISFTKGTQTGVLTFNNSCNYTYTGP